MPPEQDEEPEDADQWAAEKEEQAPEFMEPVVEVDEDEGDEVDTGKARRERDARASTLYRERRTVEEVVEDEEEEPPAPKHMTKAQRKAIKDQQKLDKEVARMERANGSAIRSSLVYKTFYDMVCNRVGVIIAGFGVAMILFTVSYDWLQGDSLSLGTKHWIALIISITVYGVGMVLEGLRMLSPECEGLEAKALRAQAEGDVNGSGKRKDEEEKGPIPMIPEEALQQLNGKRE